VKGEECKSCDAGQYRQSKKSDSTTPTDATKCVDCPMGWSSEAGSTKCQVCGAGTFGDGCQPCPFGYARNGTDHDATKCRQCELGETTSIAGATTCDKCDLGKYGSSKGECTDCPAGTYQDGKGETSCKKCDPDTYLSKTGKASKADCVACASDKTTGLLYGSTTSTSCKCIRNDFYQNSNGTCHACPDGADCSYRDGIALPQLVALNGFW
jgi:cytochrome c1